MVRLTIRNPFLAVIFRWLAMILMMMAGFVFAQTPSRVLSIAQPYTSYQSLNSDPRLITDGANGFIVLYRAKRANLPYDQIYYQRVDSAGNKYPTLDGVPVCPTRTHQTMHVACTDKKGGAFVVWQEDRTQSEQATLYIQYLNRRGENVWNPEGLRVCAGDRPQMNPRVLADDHGGVFVFWEEERNAGMGKDIYGQHFDSQGRLVWGFYGKPIVRNKGVQQNITLISAKNNMVFVVWEDFRPGRGWKIMAQKVTYAGDTQWADEGIMISNKEKNNAKNPKICSDGFGGFFCVYQAVGFKTHQQDIFLARVSPYNDILFHKVICEADEEQNDVQVAMDGDKVVVFWRDYRNGTGDIYAQKFHLILGTEHWEANGRLICSGLTEQTHPQIVIPPDSSYRLMFYQNKIYGKDIYLNRLKPSTYETNLDHNIEVARLDGDQYDYRLLVNENRTGVWIVWVDEVYSDYNTLRFQFYDFQGNFRFKNPRGGENLLSDPKSLTVKVDNPVMVLGKNNDVYLAWEDDRNGHKNADIYIQRLDSAGNPRWGTAGRVVCGAVGEQSVPRLLAVEGGVIVGWSDRRNNDDDLYVQFMDSAGQSYWQQNGLPLCTESRTQNNLQMVSLPDRKILFTWTDARDFYDRGFDIYYQIVHLSGSKFFDQNGVLLERDDTYQSSPALFTSKDRIGLTWMDERTGPYNLRTQWLDAWGKKIWNKSIPLCPGGSHQRFPKAVANDSGYVYTVWNDDRNGNLNTKVFIQKSDTAGKNLWNASGVAVCGAAGRQSAVDVIFNDRMGVFVAWLDQRDELSSAYNLYLQRLTPQGTPEWHKDGIQLGEFLHSFNPYQMFLGSNCNLLVTWSQDLSEHLTKIFWAELDVDNGSIKRKAIIDVDEGSQFRPSIVQMPDYSVGILWLQKNGLPFCQELKLGIYKSDDLKTSGRDAR